MNTCPHRIRKESQEDGIWGLKCADCGEFLPYKWNRPYTDYPNIYDPEEVLYV